ncbi:MAG TPA: hypothetical protein VFB81_12260, partial [Myxococcales bacterium]|nr:hypothetical protein [Myxococcales bacterium]
ALRRRAEEAAATRKQVQRALGQGLEGPARRYLQDVATEGLDQLGAAELQRVSEMIRGGQYDEKLAGELLAAARARSPDVPEEAFRRNLRQAVEAVAVGRQLERTGRARQRADVLAAVSEEGRAAFADLPDESIRQVRRLLEAGARGSDQLRESLYRAAAAETPGLDRGAFLKSLDAAVTHAAAERNEARRTRRSARAARLSDYPPRVRGQLSALPDDALVQLRVAQARGEQVSPQLRQSLHDAARRETPGVDLRRLDAAIDEAVRRPPAAASGPEGERLRRHLLAGVPEDQRRQLDGVPVLVMRPDEFIAFTRSASAQAATLIVEGRPVVVMREDADPRVLREEGLHALQAQEPRWRERIGTLDERRLASWDRLPLEEQLQLYRGKVEVEIDAQRRLVASLEQELERARGTNRDELALQLTRARSALENLGRRLAEVEALTPLQKRAVELGVVDRRNAVPYLDQAPRLFSKGPQNPPPRVILEPFAGPSLDSPLDLARKNPGAVVIATEATNRPPPEEVARLHAAGGAFVAENLSPGVPPSSVDEIKMRFPLPHDTAQQQAFAAQLRRLRTEFPDAPEHALLMRAMESGDFARQAESLTAYGPYALERLRPGGELEVVFWEKRIRDEAVAAQGHRFVDPADGRVYRLELVSVGTERRGDVAPHSGFGVPNVHDDMPVNVARFRKVEVPALEPVGPTGARGPASTREYDPDQAGGPVRRLDFSRIRFTGRGVDVVEAHVRRFGGGGDAELAMVARLRRIAAGEIPATDYDRAFYSHELRESVRYRRMGWPTGQPLDGDAAYELWNNLHTATLEDYRLREKLPDGDWALFHPEVMARQANGPTGARGPAPRVDWNAEVPLGLRSADAFDPDPSKGQCATWVWVIALRNAGWSGAVAVDP